LDQFRAKDTDSATELEALRTLHLQKARTYLPHFFRPELLKCFGITHISLLLSNHAAFTKPGLV